MIVPALANLEDILRLEKLERDGARVEGTDIIFKMPAGTTAMAARQAMAYLLRIVELKESSHGQRKPIVS